MSHPTPPRSILAALDLDAEPTEAAKRFVEEIGIRTSGQIIAIARLLEEHAQSFRDLASTLK